MSALLLHVRPRIYSHIRELELVELTVEPFGLRLLGGREVRTARPYTNRHYVVGCRKVGRKGVDGILISLRERVDAFEMTARWAIGGSRGVTHIVHYRVMDRDHDMASDDMVLWYAASGLWERRWAASARDETPAKAMPRMDVIDRPARHLGPQRRDIHGADGWIIQREERFDMPTIERRRLAFQDGVARPEIASAFVV